MSDLRHAGLDGTAFISVFLDETSFVYDDLDQYIYVSPGGYGEPVTDRFKAPVPIHELTLHAALPTFTIICEKYLDNLK